MPQQQPQSPSETQTQDNPRASPLTPMVNRMNMNSQNRSGTVQSACGPFSNHTSTMNPDGNPQSQTQTQVQSARQIDMRASTLTPMVNRMRVDSANRTGTVQLSRAPVINDTNTMMNDGTAVETNRSSVIQQRSTRKRTRQQYAEQQPDESSVSPSHKRHCEQKVEVADVSWHHASSPNQPKGRMRLNDDGRDFEKKANAHHNHNGHNNHQNTNGGLKPRAVPVGSTGDESLDIITSFRYHDDDDRKESERTSPQQFRYASYADYKRKSKKRLNATAHRKVSDAEWFRNQRDHSGRSRDDPDSNLKEILVPRYALQQMTPKQKQYWEFKKDRADGLLFFKVGTFYDLYCGDADIGHNQLGLEYMKDKEEPTVGFPEIKLRKYVDMATSHGYKVYRVDQMETKEQQKARKAKVVKRAVTKVYTVGTIMDEDCLGDEANYMLSIVEAPYHQMTGQIDVGVCFIDVSTGKAHIGRFIDDRNRSRLRTLLFQINPTEIVFKKDGFTKETHSLIKQTVTNAIFVELIPDEEFHCAETTKALLKNGEYWKGGWDRFPKVLKKIWIRHELAMNAVGGILFQLQHAILDQEVLPHSEWIIYDPQSAKCVEFLTLDCSTLENLDVLRNEDGDRRGTLIEFVDHCSTKFGKRMLEHWLAHPLRKVDLIQLRQDAVQYLMDDSGYWYDELDICGKLGALPDMERICQSLAALGTKDRKVDQAVMCEQIWDQIKVRKLLAALDAFEEVQAIYDEIEQHRSHIDSKLIDDITTVIERTDPQYDLVGDDNDDLDGSSRVFHRRHVPEFGTAIQKLRRSFNQEVAEKDGIIQPTKGEDEDFDKVSKALDKNTRALYQILDDIQKRFRSLGPLWEKIKFSGEKRGLKVEKAFCIEIPKKLNADIPLDWHHRESLKYVDRYQTDESIRLVKERQKLHEEEEMLLRDSARRAFYRFATNGELWKKVIDNLATLDCLLSLSRVSQMAMVGPMTRPEFVDQKGQRPFLEIRDGRHPCIDEQQLNTMGQQGTASQFIPNDTVLGIEENPTNFVIVTGPNMGGKSTMLRQSCVAVILAHIGCFVPCTSMRLTPVDRIFTRVGANDRILAGQSTFMVELEETANILQYSTERSLVILDELGRGTSTFDGTAIAYAVARMLTEEVKCRCLFSTHYHGLCDSFANDPRVGWYHMAYREVNGKITFLYKFTKGICAESHGINCARLAGLPENMLQRAEEKSKELQMAMKVAEETKLLMRFEDVMEGLIKKWSAEDIYRAATK